MACNKDRTRPAFTLVEATIALALMMVVGVIIAQCVTWTLQARVRLATHQAALELADNVLESARAQPWDQLNQAWADAQTIPTESAELLPGGTIQVLLQEGSQPLTQRVTVEVRWRFEPNMPELGVQLTTVLSARTTKKSGGVP